MKLFSIFFLCLLISFDGLAQNQNLEIYENLKGANPSDQTRVTKYLDNNKLSINGEEVKREDVAVLLVKLAVSDAKFENNNYLIDQKSFIDNEYWVFLYKGVKQLRISSTKFLPLDLEFPKPLEGGGVYVIVFNLGLGTLSITGNVEKAEVMIDGEKVSDGLPCSYTGPSGSHELVVKAEGREPYKTIVVIPMGQTEKVTATLNLVGSGSLGLVPVSASSFDMGSTRFYYEEPIRHINLMPFSVGSRLVTYELWKEILGEDETKKGPNGEVINVSYDDVQIFLTTLNEIKGETYRLPSESEWEFCAKNAEKLGIEDINKGQLEWCSDWFGKYDPTKPNGPENGIVKVVRGGSLYGVSLFYHQKTYRWHQDPSKPSEKISFRIVKEE